MVIQILESLDFVQQGTLLALELYAGPKREALFAHLPTDLAHTLRKALERIHQIESAKRIPLIVAYLKRSLANQSRSSLIHVDSTWLAEALTHESPVIAGYVLGCLPAQIVREMRQHLSPEHRQALTLDDMEMRRVILSSFESCFVPMPQLEFSRILTLRNLLLLNAKELIELVREIGQEEIATAFKTLEKEAVAQLLAPLSEDMQISVQDKVNTWKSRETSSDDAYLPELIKRVLADFQNVDDLRHRAGLRSCAKALSHDMLLSQQIAQRFTYAHGKILMDYVNMEAKDKDSDKTKLHKRILETVVTMAKNGLLDARFGACEVRV